MSEAYHIIIIPSYEGGFAVEIPDLPGCISQGETKDETLENIMDAFYLWTNASQDPEINIPIPNPLEDLDFEAYCQSNVQRGWYSRVNFLEEFSISNNMSQDGWGDNYRPTATLCIPQLGESEVHFRVYLAS